MMRFLQSISGASVILMTMATPAWAHHPLDGATPTNFIQGLLSGLGHPVIGLDHFAFLIAVGLVATLQHKPFLPPLAFLLAMVAGVTMHLGAFDLPMVEAGIALSVLLLGILAIRAKTLPGAVTLTLFAATGIFHGYAYGEAVVGAETAPLIAYFIGLLAVQYGIIAGVIWLSRRVFDSISARIAGGSVAGVGLVFLLNNLFAAA